MLISGVNSCTSCIIHNPDKIIEIFINIEKQSAFAKLIEQNKLNNKTKLLKKNDINRLGIKNDRFFSDISPMMDLFFISSDPENLQSSPAKIRKVSAPILSKFSEIMNNL